MFLLPNYPAHLVKFSRVGGAVSWFRQCSQSSHNKVNVVQKLRKSAGSREWGEEGYQECKQEVFFRRLESAVNCGRRGRAINHKRRMKKKGYNTKGRIVKNGKDPFRVIGGDLSSENEIPWQVISSLQSRCYKIHAFQVAILKAENSWDGCGALLLSCDPLIVITAAHCVQK